MRQVLEWPALPLDGWQDTYRTLHMYTQVVGKIRLALTPAMNHWWHVPLYVTARGLTTTPIPYGDRAFEMAFDGFESALLVTATDGSIRRVPLGTTVSAFYEQVLADLADIGIRVQIGPMPVEVVRPVRFDADDRAVRFDPEAVRRCFRVLSRVDQVLKRFRAGFAAKSSPVHFFWGSFDLAVTRFSGRPAPARTGDRINACAYNAELSSVGFWPGGEIPGGVRIDGPAFYAYSYPKPEGLEQAPIRPAGAYWHAALGEFILPYEAVRRSSDPARTILEFADSAFQAGARLAGWPPEAVGLPPAVARCL
ncbi:MAG TPA: DUF5996 family protein [Stenomitos sp.]